MADEPRNLTKGEQSRLRRLEEQISTRQGQLAHLYNVRALAWGDLLEGGVPISEVARASGKTRRAVREAVDLRATQEMP